jgi:hypothetical protein
MTSRSRWYLVSLVVRFCLAVLPLSVLHPDEWMQSAQPMARSLKPDVSGQAEWSTQQTWDWRFTCTNRTHLAHEGKIAARFDSQQREFICEGGLELQPPIRGVLAPSVCRQHLKLCSEERHSHSLYDTRFPSRSDG